MIQTGPLDFRAIKKSYNACNYQSVVCVALLSAFTLSRKVTMPATAATKLDPFHTLFRVSSEITIGILNTYNNCSLKTPKEDRLL